MDKQSARNGWVSELLIGNVCVPFIQRFLHSIVNKSSEALILETNGHRYVFGNKVENNNENLQPVTIHISNPLHFCWLILMDEKMGLGEAYMAGDWNAEPNPTEFLSLLIRAKKSSLSSPRVTQAPWNRFITWLGSSFLSIFRTTISSINYLKHRIHDNTLQQSAKNIKEHYDLGNDMFRMFLDDTMTYSCAVFQEPLMPVVRVDFRILKDAQLQKIDNLIDMLNIGHEDTVLEIGCGWGACAIRAAQRTGCQWTGLTISQEQLEWGLDKVQQAGLENRINLQYLDYRQSTGEYSRLISVEMIEAVGQVFLPQFFQIIEDRLRNGGRAVLQAIICPDAYYDRYCKSSDFIKKYIFPGGHMPSIGAIQQSLPSKLEMGYKVHIGRHYAKTLDHWHCAWMMKSADIRNLGYSIEFHRKWQYYFCLCSALFANNHIDTIQFVLEKQP